MRAGCHITVSPQLFTLLSFEAVAPAVYLQTYVDGAGTRAGRRRAAAPRIPNPFRSSARTGLAPERQNRACISTLASVTVTPNGFGTSPGAAPRCDTGEASRRGVEQGVGSRYTLGHGIV